ncbi:hypothetical protein HK099_001211 [Clydaea vesicula]|uniref:SH3 domain-containing protein n=1 Tax=Clydaea vesicula TaxID=447962 RepID=A0AAD5U3N1_9FUNG|nr:hypothetical protein HK099_001211 [Clydaea vesicula]
MLLRILLNLSTFATLAISTAQPLNAQCDPSNLNKISNQYTLECVKGCCLIDPDDLDCPHDCYQLTNNNNDDVNNNKNIKAVVQQEVDSTDGQTDECIEIDKTSACAPWQSGYYINKTELSLVYGQKIAFQEDWDNFVYSATSGGEYQAKLWNDWAKCTKYKGAPIQYSRTYTCLTDIFLFSSGCNKKAPQPSPCPDFCEVYGKAVETLLSDDEACPNVQEFIENEEEYLTVESRRTILASAASGCKEILTSWSSGKYEGKVHPNQGFTSGGYAYDYEDGVYFTESSCPSEKFINGVDEDAFYCGFGGNLNAANSYCKDFNDAPCCKILEKDTYKIPHYTPKSENKKQKATKKKQNQLSQGPKSIQQLNSENLSGNQDNAQSASQPEKSAAPIVAASLGSIGLVGLAVGAGFIVKRKRSRSGAKEYQSPTKVGMTSSKKPKTSLNTRLPVVHEYHQSLPDEVELRKGDIVEVISSYDDGWAKGRNITTGLEGTFPLACLEKQKKTKK